MNLLFRPLVILLIFLNLSVEAFSQTITVGILAKRGEAIEKNRFYLTNSYQAILIKKLALKRGYSYKVILSLGQYEQSWSQRR